jgi:hypothetical protein
MHFDTRQRAVRPAPGPGGARRTATGISANILALHTAIGNRNLQQVVAPGRVLARYDTGEHAQFGLDRVVYVRGDVQITEQEMIALGGDLYERLEDIDQADLDELRKLVELVRRDRDAYLGVGGAAHVSNEAWQKATKPGPHRKKSFLELAEDNATHFAPREQGSDGRDHKAQWERMHRQALDIAHTARTVEEARRATAYNAFAGHFLTDAFSSGHLISKLDVVDFAKKNFDVDETWGTVIKETRFTREVATRLLEDPRSGPKLKQFKIRIVRWGDMDAEKLSELLYGTADDHPELFFGVYVKLIHDWLNEAGVEVANAHGDTWTVFGDDFMAKSPDTLRIGNAAVEQSDRNLAVAHATPGPLDYQALFDKVWSYTPRPTERGSRLIDHTIARIGNPLNKHGAMKFADFVADHIDGVIDHLKDEQRLATEAELAGELAAREQEADERRGHLVGGQKF